MAAPLAAAPDPVAEPIVLVIERQTFVVNPDDPAWPIAHYAREREQQVQHAERDLRNKRAQIARLQADAEHDRKTYVGRARIEALFAHWQKRCKHTRAKLTPERFDAARALIEKGYTDEQLTRAIDGAAFDCFTKPRKNGTIERFDDFELVFRDGVHVERFANRAPVAP